SALPPDPGGKCFFHTQRTHHHALRPDDRVICADALALRHAISSGALGPNEVMALWTRGAGRRQTRSQPPELPPTWRPTAGIDIPGVTPALPREENPWSACSDDDERPPLFPPQCGYHL